MIIEFIWKGMISIFLRTTWLISKIKIYPGLSLLTKFSFLFTKITYAHFLYLMFKYAPPPSKNKIVVNSLSFKVIKQPSIFPGNDVTSKDSTFENNFLPPCTQNLLMYNNLFVNIFFCFQDYENYASENMSLNHTITIMKQEFNNIRNQKQFKH